MNNTPPLNDQDKALLEQLAAQYKLYHEEIRVYLGFEAGISTLLAILIFSVFTAARGPNPDARIYLLIPIAIVWAGALLSLFTCGGK